MLSNSFFMFLWRNKVFSLSPRNEKNRESFNIKRRKSFKATRGILNEITE